MTNDDEIECPECRGTKVVHEAFDIVPANRIPEDPPPKDCPRCGGTGRVKKEG